MTPSEALREKEVFMTTDCDAEDRVLVFSIAMNGYGWAWRSCIRGHRKFAEALEV